MFHVVSYESQLSPETRILVHKSSSILPDPDVKTCHVGPVDRGGRANPLRGLRPPLIIPLVGTLDLLLDFFQRIPGVSTLADDSLFVSSRERGGSDLRDPRPNARFQLGLPRFGLRIAACNHFLQHVPELFFVLQQVVEGTDLLPVVVWQYMEPARKIPCVRYRCRQIGIVGYGIGLQICVFHFNFGPIVLEVEDVVDAFSEFFMRPDRGGQRIYIVGHGHASCFAQTDDARCQLVRQ